MKSTVVLTAASSLGLVGGMSQRALADAVSIDPLPWTAQLGVCGGCLTILLVTIWRVIPKMAEENRKSIEEMSDRHVAALDGVGDKLEGVRSEIRAGNDSQLALLRNVLHQKDTDAK